VFAALFCMGIFIFAVVKSSQINTPVGPKLTQQAISRKLYTVPPSTQSNPATDRKTAHTKPTVNDHKPSQQNTVAPPKNAPRTLARTGPGDTIAIFCLTSVFGTTAAYILQFRVSKNELVSNKLNQ
jgi:hypothetical protein